MQYIISYTRVTVTGRHQRGFGSVSGWNEFEAKVKLGKHLVTKHQCEHTDIVMHSVMIQSPLAMIFGRLSM